MSKYQDYTSLKPPQSYTKNQLENIKLISTGKNSIESPFGERTGTPFGSATYRIQKYPGDLDVHEVFTGCCDIKSVINKFEKILKNIVKNEESKPEHYVVEVKAGLDQRYDIDVGRLLNGRFYINDKEIKKKLKYFEQNNLLNEKEIKQIKNVLKKEYPNQNDYDTVYNILRERKILRWTADEILKGYKILPGDKKITLNKALYSKTFAKIDVIALINGKFVEITNFFILMYEDRKGKLHPINLDYNFLDNSQAAEVYEFQIKDEIEKFLLSK